MFLVDSSAWIEYLRPNGSDKVKQRIRDVLQREEAVSCGIIVVEILRGAKNEKEFKLLSEALTSIPRIHMDKNVIKIAAKLGFLLDRKGKTVSTTDLFIAAAAYSSKMTVLHFDNDFETIASEFDLKQKKL